MQWRMTITGKLKEIANVIREKTNTADLMRLDQMDELIDMGRVREL